MKRISHGLLVLAAAVLLPSAAAAQPPDPLLNMQAIAAALGVQCSYCHARQQEGTALDFQSFDNPKKEIARQMIAMTRELNARIQTATGKSATDATAVHCLTCHRGTPVPRKLIDVISLTLREQGVEAATAEYRALRAKYYGRDTYDFAEAELLNFMQLLAEVRPDDAIALGVMNLEFNPKSVNTYLIMSRAYSRKREYEAAIAQLKKALEIEPEHGVIKGHLLGLEEDQRRRLK